MSGGSYKYKYEELRRLAEMLQRARRDDDNNEIRIRLGRAVEEMAKQCKIVEWIDSGDSGLERFDKVENWLDEHNF